MKKKSRTKDINKHAKLRELILYVSDKCQDHTKFGATKLNKILFFADFIAYAKRGRSITNEKYFKLPFGPAPQKLVFVRRKMIDDGILVIQHRETLSGTQERPIPMRAPDLSIFESWEIDLVNSVINELRNRDADEVSDLSHYYMGWRLAKEQEEIPYETVFIRDPEEILVTEKRKARARELVKIHGSE